MSDIIQLLPDSVANQIAAGEVIQRPASVIKELLENSVDSGADNISVIIKDAGKTLIQVIDNGSGMSETDARLSFERHATSKIRKAEDLFTIHTMGFRGEALASIAAIAYVELKTRLHDSDIGTHIVIEGSEVKSQEPAVCSAGSSMMVKNLFYNIPARRKFLKQNSTEFAHIIAEFQKVAFTRPDISLTLTHNDKIIYSLEKTNKRQRIIGLIGKSFNNHLIPISSNTSIIKIDGFIGKPEMARKTKADTYFFANNRYMKHPYFHKAVCSAFENVIGHGEIPSYFIYIDISPDLIDINIHPQKTEINFDNSPAIFQIIRATVREGLGKFNIVPSIDFEGAISIPNINKDTVFKMPELDIDKTFNPFEQEKKFQNSNSGHSGYVKRGDKYNFGEQEEIFAVFFSENSEDNQNRQQSLDVNNSSEKVEFLNIQNKYIVLQTEQGLTLIDQKRAHARILYEQFFEILQSGNVPVQKLLYPEKIELKPDDFAVFFDMNNQIVDSGFDIELTVNNEVIIKGVPAVFSEINCNKIIESLVEDIRIETDDFRNSSKERIAKLLAKSSSINFGDKLSQEEIQQLIKQLFECQMPNFSPDNQPVIINLSIEEISKMFKRK